MVRERIALGALLIVGGCASSEAPRPARAGAIVSDTVVKIGPPYMVNGTRYVPADDHYYDAIGLASRYGAESGTRTANGEVNDSRGYSAAHPTLPLPSYVEVTELGSGRTIVVRINDRGPFARGRLIDLSGPAAAALGIAGTAAVRVRRVFPSEAERAALRAGQAAGPRLAASPQLLAALRARLGAAGGGTVRLAEGPMPDVRALNADTRMTLPAASVSDDAPPLPIAAPSVPRPPKRVPEAIAPRARPAAPAMPIPAHGASVQIGAFGDRARAEKLAGEVGGQATPAGALYRVRVGPYATEAAAREALAKLRARGYAGAAIVRD